MFNHSVAIVGSMCHVFLGNTQLYATQHPSFLVDGTDRSILKHGPVDEIQQEHEKLCKSFLKLDLDPTDLQVVIFDPVSVGAAMLSNFMDDKRALPAWQQTGSPALN